MLDPLSNRLFEPGFWVNLGFWQVFPPFAIALIALVVWDTCRSEARFKDALRSGKKLSAVDLSKASGFNSGGIYRRLFRMEAEGVIDSEFLEGPYPRKRVYWMVKP